MSKGLQKGNRAKTKAAGVEMRKKPKDWRTRDAYVQNWTPYTTASGVAAISNTLGNPTFNATMRLGDNSADPNGTTEIILNGSGGQLQWGSDENDYLNTTTNYPNGCPFSLIINPNSNPAPATLTVGGVQVSCNQPAFSYITGVCVEAIVNTGGTPVDCVWVAVTNLSILTEDASQNATADPGPGPNYTNPIATQGATCSVGNGDNVFALLATPASPFQPVQVTVSGNVAMISTDPYYQNAGLNLGLASIQLKILVYTS